MNKSHNRLIRATLAIGSFAAILVVGVPWVDEYLQRRRDAVELTTLKSELEQTSLRDQRLSQIASKLVDSLAAMQKRSIVPSEASEIRELLTEVVRASGAQLRHIEVAPGLSRPWALEDDDPRQQMSSQFGEESGFQLTSVSIDLRAAGSIEAIHTILRNIAANGWLMSTTSMTLVPTEGKGADVSLEVRLTAYGLEAVPQAPTDQFTLMPQRHPVCS